MPLGNKSAANHKFIPAGVERWISGNRIRLIVEMFGFIFPVIALRVWSAENARLDERARATKPHTLEDLKRRSIEAIED